MAERGQQIFRAKALERISSPENIDQLMQVVSPKDWLPLVVLGSLTVLAVVWSVTGRVPTTVSARGILTHPHRVLDLQTLGSGRLEKLHIKTGDIVRKDDIIAYLDQFELRRRLEEDRGQLAELQAQNLAKNSIQTERLRLQRQQTELEGTFASSQTVNLRKTLADAEAIEPLLKKKLDSLRTLRAEGLLPELSPDLIQAEQAYVENGSRITDATARLRQLDLERKQSEALETGVSRENLDSETGRRNQIQEIRSRISISELQLERNSTIQTSYSGRILEVFATDGQIVSSGTRIATIEVDDPDNQLINISYFTVGDGKKIQPGMRVQVTPDTVERQRFGGITGVVTSVSSLPVTLEGSKALVGNADVAQMLMQGGAHIEVLAQLDRDPGTESGYHWSSSRGPSMKIDTGITDSVRVTVETRSPITYLFPFLREVTGVY